MQDYSDTDTIVKDSTQTSRFSLGPWGIPLTIIALAFILLGFGIACVYLYHAYYFATDPTNIEAVFNYLVGEERFYLQWLNNRIELDSSVRILVVAITFSVILSPIYAFISAMVKAGTGILSFLKEYEKSLR